MSRIRNCIFAFVATVLMAPSVYAVTADYPPTSAPGQCFARVLMPDTVQTVTERVEATPASTELIKIPAVYETQTVRVMVKEASKAFRTIPAVYETVTERVLIKPARETIVTIPAKYETYTETVELEPAKLVWKTGAGLYGRGMAGTTAAAPSSGEVATGEILCKVMQPAKVRTVRRTRMVEPPRSERRTIPARYETVVKQVVVQPPRLTEIELPAEYADIDVRVMVQPERTDVQTIPATYRTVERKVVTSQGGLSWSEVLCDTNTTRMKVREIQRALVSAGYPILVDGLYGPQTQQAMERYQREKGLAVGYMTVETVRSLGIDPYT